MGAARPQVHESTISSVQRAYAPPLERQVIGQGHGQGGMMSKTVRRARSARLRLWLAAICVAAILPLAWAAPAAASSTGAGGINISLPTGFRLSGRVIDAANAGVPGLDVLLCRSSEDCSVRSTTTIADGSFTIRGVIAGTYLLTAFAESARNFVTTWFAGASSTTDPTQAIDIDVSANVSGLGITMASGFTVSGTVTGPDAQPVANVEVDVNGSSSGGQGFSDANGHYVAGGLTAGSYSIFVRPPSDSNFMPGPVFGGTVVEGFDSEFFDVTADLSGRDVTLAAGETISGNIRGLVRPATIVAAGSAAGYAIPIAANGDFKISALWPDQPVQLIVQEGRSATDSQFPVGVYDGTSILSLDQSTAANVDMSLGNVTGISARVPRSPSVQGRILGADAAPVHGWVVLCGDAGCGQSSIGTSGSYAFWNLPAGAYTVYIVAFEHEQGYVTASGGVSPNFGDASPIIVGKKDVLRDVTLPAGYTISGRITGPAGEGLAGAVVYSAHTSHQSGHSTLTDSAGNYVIRGLSAGDYVVAASGAEGSDYLANFFWTPSGATTDFDLAGVVTLPPTSTFITGTSPVNGATGVPRTAAPAVTFSDSVHNVTRMTVFLHPLGSSTNVSATVTYDAITHAAVITPKTRLRGSTTYVFEISGVTAADSTPIPALAVQFTTQK